ncbi:MAG TPA: MarR family transcriptional regulator [Mycobacteriales bacterium]|nr:MarR family transcriptional regulator [Mycobacteriales bacterium]
MATPGIRPLDEQEMGAWHALIRAHSRVIRRLEVELDAEHGLSLPAYEVLAHLSMAPEQRLRMSELAVHAVLSPSGLTRLVDKLAREGLVCRDKCSADARVVYAVLTSEGRTRLKAAYPTHLRGVREHFIDLLTTQQRDAVADALGGIVERTNAECEAVVAAACESAEQDAELTRQES